jgi:hypothetical protein
MANEQIIGISISENTVLSVMMITNKQINASPRFIAPISGFGMPKANTVNRNKITVRIANVIIPVIFSGLSLKPLIFVLISDNDEYEFNTNLLKNLS